MAFLLPDNIPSRSGIPNRLRQTARALKVHTPEEMTVWLREADNGSPYLVLLDPDAGIMVIDAPRLLARSQSRGQKNRIFNRSRKRQGRVFDSFEMLRIPEEISKQAIELKRGLDETSIRNLPVECVLAVPDRDKDEGSVDQLSRTDRELPVLWQTDFQKDRLTGALRNILRGGQHPPLQQQEQNRVRAVVNPEIILARQRIENLPLFQDPETAPEDVIHVMDREQERVAEHLGFGYRVLRGVAGSGKTLVLVYRARYLRRLWSECRILVLCFNRVLANALETMLEIDENLDENLQVINIDRLAWNLAEQGNRGNHKRSARSGRYANQSRSHRSDRPGAPADHTQSADQPNSDSVSVYDQRILEAREAAKNLPDSQRYDMVLVDEAQDFDHSRLDLAYTMLKPDRLVSNPKSPDRDNFVVAFDVAQNVYRRNGARWNPPGLDALGRRRTARGRSSVFRKNYRNTREILEFAMNFLAGSREWKETSVDSNDPAALVPPEAARRSGPLPHLTAHRDLRGEAESIASRVAGLLTGGTDAEDIIVMYGCYQLETELRQAFSRRDLPYFHIQERNEKGWLINRDKAVCVRGKVRASTLSGIKGLEFSRVFIGGVNQIRIPDVDEQDQLQTAKSYLYVAMTRARDELYITMSGGGEIGGILKEAERLSG